MAAHEWVSTKYLALRPPGGSPPQPPVTSNIRLPNGPHRWRKLIAGPKNSRPPAPAAAPVAPLLLLHSHQSQRLPLRYTARHNRCCHSQESNAGKRTAMRRQEARLRLRQRVRVRPRPHPRWPREGRALELTHDRLGGHYLPKASDGVVVVISDASEPGARSGTLPIVRIISLCATW